MTSLFASVDNASPALHGAPFRKTFSEEPVILVVEDDPAIRRFVCCLLKYATRALVIEASGPHSAVSRARCIARPVDLLISDVDLSCGSSGIDLARELAAIMPFMRVLLMSASEIPLTLVPRDWRFLSKPFPISEFLNCVGELSGSVRPYTAIHKA